MRSRTCAHSLRYSAVVPTTAPSASFHTCAAASITGRRTRSSTKRRRSARGRSRNHARRPNRQRMARSRRRRRFRRSLPNDRGALAGLERLTFISPHPKDFTEKILDDLGGVPQLNPRIHLPLQSGSDAVLRRMNRKYTLAGFADRRLVRSRLPECAITTDIIVGFPGETEADFEATLELRANGRLCKRLHVHLLDSTRNAGRELGAGTAGRRARALCAAGRRAEPRDARVSRSQSRSSRASADRGRFQERREPTDRQDARQRHDRRAEAARLPVERRPQTHPYARTPWLDVAIESAHVWGCSEPSSREPNDSTTPERESSARRSI